MEISQKWFLGTCDAPKLSGPAGSVCQKKIIPADYERGHLN